MTVLPPSDAAGAFEARLRDMERRLGNIETMRRTPFTETYDSDGNLAMRLSEDGLFIFDDDGNPQLRAGDLDGEGDYGVEIGGGRARPIGIETNGQLRSDMAITATEQVAVSLPFTPPPWATQASTVAHMVFQMNNSSGVAQKMHFRIDVNGLPGTGLMTNWVENGYTGHVSDAIITNLMVTGPFAVDAIVRVDQNTNNVNDVRLYAQVTYLR